jgi:zinc finger MYND domain-containing protein 10
MWGLAQLATLVTDLLTTELWRERVLPLVLASGFEDPSAFGPYMCAYHEVTVASLLETVLYHQETCDALGDAALDLVDYCHRRINWWLGIGYEEEQQQQQQQRHTDTASKEALLNQSPRQQIEEQLRGIQFATLMSSVSILSYLVTQVVPTSVSLSSRIVRVHDTVCMLVAMLHQPPWARTRGGRLEKFRNGQWEAAMGAERMRLVSAEGQTWIMLFTLLMGDEFRRKYEYNTHRREEVLKVRQGCRER